jgi:hypothetical protein
MLLLTQVAWEGVATLVVSRVKDHRSAREPAAGSETQRGSHTRLWPSQADACLEQGDTMASFGKVVTMGACERRPDMDGLLY